jgi:hypothetical protein
LRILGSAEAELEEGQESETEQKEKRNRTEGKHRKNKNQKQNQYTRKFQQKEKVDHLIDRKQKWNRKRNQRADYLFHL